MNTNIVIVEGYDGSGKGTLIERLRESLGGKRVRVLGRKTEVELRPISLLIEQTPPTLCKETEILLRIALEFERLELLRRAQSEWDIIMLDRGIISLVSWVDYYDLDSRRYASLFSTLESALDGAKVLICSCDFETCWRRALEKETKSKKELLGEATNRRYYEKYMRNVELFRNRNSLVSTVDTTCSIAASLNHALSDLSL